MSRYRLAGQVIALGVVVFSGGACGVRTSDVQPRRVIVISLDTTRADRLGCYGWRQGTTPNIDRVARDGILFENAQTTAPLTLPAHASLMTGLELHEHGVLNNGHFKLLSEQLTLAEVLSADGWKTGAVISAIVLDSRYGIAQGFQFFDDHIGENRNPMGIQERQADESTSLAIDWLGRNQDEPVFFWLHLFDPHFTYDPPSPFKGKFPGLGYEDEIAFADAQIGRLIDDLKERDLYDSTLLIIVADHGEAFQEHQEQTHGYFVYQPTMHIPLIIKPAGAGSWRGRRITKIAGIIDIFPTVLDVLEIEPKSSVTGVSLKPMWEGFAGGDERILASQSIVPSFYGANALHSLYRGQWKLIRDSQPELYDLRADPDEIHNLTAVYPEVAADLGNLLAGRLEGGVAAAQVTMSSEERIRLQALGYVSGPIGAQNAPGDFDSALPSAHDFFSAYKKSSNVQVKMIRGQLDEARALCEAVLELAPEHIDSLLNLAEIMYREGDLEAAEGLFRRAITINPRVFHAWNNLGVALARQGRQDEAVDAFLRAESLDSGFASVPANLGAIYRKRGETDEAVRAFLEALQRDPDHFEALQNLGQIAGERGEAGESQAYFETALDVMPGNVGVSLELGTLLADQGNWSRTAEVLQAASTVEPNNVDVLRAHALALAKVGEEQRALEIYRRCLVHAPFDPVLLHQAAVVADQIGKHKEAIRLWERSLDIWPDQSQALNGLAWRLMMERGDNPKEIERSLGYARKACELARWSDASLIDTLAAVLAATGRFEAAVSRAQEALELARNHDQDDLARDIEARLDEYRKASPPAP